MLTGRHWIQVLALATAWLVTGSLFTVARRRLSGRGFVSKADGVSGREILAWSSSALWFGVVGTFGWDAFRIPLVFLTIGTFAFAVIFSRRSSMAKNP